MDALCLYSPMQTPSYRYMYVLPNSLSLSCFHQASHKWPFLLKYFLIEYMYSVIDINNKKYLE